MAVRFFMMQTHYRSTLDVSNEALQAAEKGYQRLMSAIKTLNSVKASDVTSVNLSSIRKNAYDAMNDDFNSPVMVAQLFELVRIINSANDGKEQMTKEDIAEAKSIIQHFVFDIAGLMDDSVSSGDQSVLDNVMQLVLEMRNQAKAKKEFSVSDHIRNSLVAMGINVKDSKDGSTWEKI